MRIFNRLSIAIIFAIVIMLVGCSNGHGDNPISPSSDGSNTPSTEISVNVPDNLQMGASPPMVFGIFEVELNTENLEGSIHPLRTTDILGDSFMVDITPFLSITPCSDCIDIKSIALSANGNVEITFRTKHPFDTSKRYDLHVFDLRGIIVSGDNVQQFDNVRIDMDNDGSFETASRGNVEMLVNADGYTSFYDIVVEDYLGKIFDSNICPFKNMWVNPRTESPDSNYNPGSEFGFSDLENPTGHNVFPMGSTFDSPFAETMFELDLSNSENVNFLLILEASYGHTTTRHTRKEPRFFLPEFHRKEAWMVTVELMNNELRANSVTSSAILSLSVIDWQAGIAPTGGWDYETSNLDEIRHSSDVDQIIVDIPNVLANPKSATLADITGGLGTFGNPYVWDFEILNEQGANEGTYWGLVAVRDEMLGSSDAPLGISGDLYNPIQVFDLTTYQSFEVSIEFLNILPVADVDVAPNPVRVCSDVTISIGTNCGDVDGTIISYEYMFDYDGTPANFSADVTQNTGDVDFGDDVITQYSETEVGTYTIAQRVTDDVASTDIDTFDLDVQANQAPTAELQDDDADDAVTVCDTVTFQPGPTCGDTDGAITRYEYDYDYDGTTFSADVTQNSGDADFGDPVTHEFTNPGPGPLTFTAAIQVTDDGCPDLTAIDSTVFTISPLSGQLYYEDFESATPGSVPIGWGITGHTGGAYYLNTAGMACTDTDWRWGVTNNSGLCEPGYSGFLNESGATNPNSDPSETYQNRANIVYTPEFTVPPGGATVTIRHNYNMLYGVLGGVRYLDGGRVILSTDDPGTIDWDDFCTYSSLSGIPLRPLARISGPNFNTISSYAGVTHPLRNMQAHAGSSGGWTTSVFDVPSSYACETVRLGFLFASDDLLLGYLSNPPFSFYSDCTQYLPPPYNTNIHPQWGWRINWVDITAN